MSSPVNLTPSGPPETVRRWPVAALSPNPLNPRGPVAPEDVEDLAASIRAHGYRASTTSVTASAA